MISIQNPGFSAWYSGHGVHLITELVYKPLMPGVKDRVMEKP